MKKNYGLLIGCLVVAALGVIYAGVGAYQAHTKEKEQQQAENENIYMTDLFPTIMTEMVWNVPRMAIPGCMTVTTSLR